MRRCPDVPPGETEHDNGGGKSPRCDWHRDQWARHARALRDAPDDDARARIRYEPSPRLDHLVDTVITPAEREALAKALISLQASSAAARHLFTTQRPEVRRQPAHAALDDLSLKAQAIAAQIAAILNDGPRRRR